MIPDCQTCYLLFIFEKYFLGVYIGNDAISSSKKVLKKQWISFGTIVNLKKKQQQKTPMHMFQKIQEFRKNPTKKKNKMLNYIFWPIGCAKIICNHFLH